MSEEVSLYDLLNISIGTPQKSSVNFGALHSLLLALLKHLNLREVTIRWGESSPGYVSPDLTAAEEVQVEVQPGPVPDQLKLLSRIQTCEDGLSKTVGDALGTAARVESCCHRVDALEETVKSLSDAVLPGNREGETEEPGDSGVLTEPPQSSTPPSSHPDNSAGKPPASDCDSSAPSPQAAEALRSVSQLQERLVQVEARVEVLEEGKADRSQLAQLRELVATKDSHGDAFSNLRDQLNEQRGFIDRLMSDRGKLDDLRATLENTIMSFTPQLSTCDEAVRAESGGPSDEWSALDARTTNIGEKLGRLFEHYEQLQDAVNRLIRQQGGAREGPPQEREASQSRVTLGDVSELHAGFKVTSKLLLPWLLFLDLSVTQSNL